MLQDLFLNENNFWHGPLTLYFWVFSEWKTNVLHSLGTKMRCKIWREESNYTHLVTTSLTGSLPHYYKSQKWERFFPKDMQFSFEDKNCFPFQILFSRPSHFKSIKKKIMVRFFLLSVRVFTSILSNEFSQKKFLT